MLVEFSVFFFGVEKYPLGCINKQSTILFYLTITNANCHFTSLCNEISFTLFRLLNYLMRLIDRFKNILRQFLYIARLNFVTSSCAE